MEVPLPQGGTPEAQRGRCSTTIATICPTSLATKNFGAVVPKIVSVAFVVVVGVVVVVVVVVVTVVVWLVFQVVLGRSSPFQTLVVVLVVVVLVVVVLVVVVLVVVVLVVVMLVVAAVLQVLHAVTGAIALKVPSVMESVSSSL